MRILLGLILGFLLLGCGSTFVDYDYDTGVDFTQYTSYNYDWENISGLSEFDERRYIKSTDSLLQARGWTLSNDPDILIRAQSSEIETSSRNTIGIGIGGVGGNVGGGVSGGIPVGGRELHRELIVSIVDVSKNTIVWEARSESDLKVNATPQQREIYFSKLVTKIFKKYPPENK